MPSSISSSDVAASDVQGSTSKWGLAWIVALLLAAALVGAVEHYWRAHGYRPNIRDSAQLWSIERDRAVRNGGRTPLVLLGASRIEFGVDMKLLAQLLPRYRPLMLAQNAHYPLAALRDLAADDAFHGVVLCDVEANALVPAYRDMQQPLVDYRRREWAPSWRVHRVLLTDWQRHAVVADPDLGVVASVRRWLAGEAPPRPEYFRFHADRSGDIDYAQTDVAAAKKHFAEVLQQAQDLHGDATPDAWRAGLPDIYAWTRRIQARGGSVIFYQSPTGETLRRIDALRYPPAEYWDRFVAGSPAPVINANAEPSLLRFELPDDSHLDYRDKTGYTQALVAVLLERGLVER